MRLRKAKVLFRSANNWADWILPDGFGHVAIELEDSGEFVLIDTGMDNTYVNKYTRVVMWEQHGYRVVDIEIPEDANVTFPQCLFGCVNMVKSIVGISNFFIQTPKQLYKHLLKKESRYGRSNTKTTGEVTSGD